MLARDGLLVHRLAGLSSGSIGVASPRPVRVFEPGGVLFTLNDRLHSVIASNAGNAPPATHHLDA